MVATLLIAGGAAAFGGVQLADQNEPAPEMRQVAELLDGRQAYRGREGQSDCCQKH